MDICPVRSGATGARAGVSRREHFGSRGPKAGRASASRRRLAAGRDEHRGGGGEERRAGWRPEPGVEHHPEKALRVRRGFRPCAGVLAVELRGADGEAGVVGEHRAAPGEEGAGLGPPALHVAAGRFPGDPSARAVRKGGPPVEARGELQAHERPAARGAPEEPGVEVGRGPRDLRAVGGRRLDSGRPQALEPAARDPRVGVPNGGDHPGHPGLDERGGAGRRPAVVAAGLEGHVGGRAPRPRPRHLKGAHLGVGLSRPPMPALADDFPVPRQHAAHPGIRVGGEEPAAREGERTLQELAVAHPLLPRSERKLRAPRLRSRRAGGGAPRVVVVVARRLPHRRKPGHVHEVTAPGREPDVGHGVEGAELVHDPLSDPGGEDLALLLERQPLPDAADRGVDIGRGDRALLDRPQDRAPQPPGIEGGAVAASLDDPGQRVRHLLPGGEPLAARAALAPALPFGAAGRDARVDDLALSRRTARAAHGRTIQRR